MNSTTIGAIISKLRYEKEYSRQKLCRGLCSTQMLIKIENDEVAADIFLIDMLIQRLGKAPDKLEVIISDEEYQKIYLRDKIEELIWRDKKKEAHCFIEQYEQCYAKDSNVQKMFILRTKAYVNRYLNHDIEMTEKYIRQAIEQTLPGFHAQNMQKYLIAGNEMENLLEWGRCLMEMERTEEAELLLRECQEYIDKNITDDVEYARLNSKSAWVRSCLYVKKKLYMQAYQVCESAVQPLRKYGILHFMVPLLEQLVFCSEQLNIVPDKSKWRVYYDILIELYDEYGEAWYCQTSLYHNSIQTNYHLKSEFIRQERMAREFTQEQLIEGVYETPENLSRVECGKSNPTKKKFEGLMENLGIERGTYCGTVAADNYEVLELKHEIDVLIGMERHQEAQDILNRLRGMLDCSKKTNNTAIRIYQSMLDVRCGKMDEQTAYENLMCLLADIGLMKNNRLYRVPFYNEMLALNLICACLRKMGRLQEGIEIYENILRVVTESKVDEKYQNKILSLTLANIDLFDCKKKWCDRGISYELSCGAGKMIYMHFVAQFSLEEDEKTRRKIIRLAYYMSDLFLRDTNTKQIRAYYERMYGEKLL